ncbi:MAG TPA: Fe-S cluster assembly protein SufD, partial [Acidimicrobiia bacterium]|nr:Fe-S cluster assembly protein SufD [Acidimicrobiia bacterium]
ETAARARAWLETHGFPGKRDEAWRTTPVDEVLALLGRAVPPPPRAEPLDRSVIDELGGHHGGPRLVFVNGAPAPDLSDPGPLPAGCYLGGLAGAPAWARSPGPPVEPVDGFDALKRQAGRDAAGVAVPRGTRLDAPVHVVHLAVPGGATTVSHPRTVVHAAATSRLAVIETYAGLPGHSLTNASTAVVAGPGAGVTYQRVQSEAADAIHLGRAVIGQAAGSDVRAVSVMTGAATARFAADVTLGGPEAQLALDGLYLPRARQRHDHVITVDHAASRCRSTQRFKAIVDDHGYGSFVGRIIVRPGTVASDASQASHSLLLLPTAQADSRPWLEIFADDVRCVHGATVGRLAEEALFYLRSRGVPLPEARAMLVAAFADELTSTLTPATLRERVIAATRPAGARP